jgi:protein-disulfide isomerase-like protein with CxxC motif
VAVVRVLLTFLPAFEAAWCAARQGEQALATYDLRVRRAFFAEGRNIGRWDVLREIAEEAGLDRERFDQDMAGGEARIAVVEEARLGRERYRVRGTPTLMLADGTKLRHPIAYPRMEERQVVGVAALPCCGEGCLEATRAMLEQAVRAGASVD